MTNQNRPTREIEIEGIKVVMREYITGKENDDIVKCYQTKKESNEMRDDAERKAAELVLVSLDGVTEKLYDYLMDLPLIKVSAIKQEMSGILNPVSSNTDETKKE